MHQGGSFDFKGSKSSQHFRLDCRATDGKVGPSHAPLNCTQHFQKLATEVKARERFEEWKKMNANADAAFHQLLENSGWKKYPACGAPIERNQGCDHMTCSRCRCHFCYV